MRRDQDTSLYAKARYDGGRFEVVIKSPTVGLVTRVPGDQPDARAATVASNVRFDDGVIRNAPGCAAIFLSSPLDSEPNLIFQANVLPASGSASQLGNVLIGTSAKLYFLTALSEAQFPLFEEQAVEFLPTVKSYYDFRLVKTFDRLPPQLFAISLNDDVELWVLRARANTESDDGLSFLLPLDYGAQTNNVILARVR